MQRYLNDCLFLFFSSLSLLLIVSTFSLFPSMQFLFVFFYTELCLSISSYMRLLNIALFKIVNIAGVCLFIIFLWSVNVIFFVEIIPRSITLSHFSKLTSFKRAYVICLHKHTHIHTYTQRYVKNEASIYAYRYKYAPGRVHI